MQQKPVHHIRLQNTIRLSTKDTDWPTAILTAVHMVVQEEVQAALVDPGLAQLLVLVVLLQVLGWQHLVIRPYHLNRSSTPTHIGHVPPAAKAIYVLLCIRTTVLNNNTTHEATVALLPSTMHPQSWVEPHTHAHTCKSLGGY